MWRNVTKSLRCKRTADQSNHYKNFNSLSRITIPSSRPISIRRMNQSQAYVLACGTVQSILTAPLNHRREWFSMIDLLWQASVILVPPLLWSSWLNLAKHTPKARRFHVERVPALTRFIQIKAHDWFQSENSENEFSRLNITQPRSFLSTSISFLAQ